jgi:hypothetical protein
MSDSYDIITDGLKPEEVVRQLRAIKTFPCVVKLYDRIFPLRTQDEAWAIGTGLEIGFFLAEDVYDKDKDK